MDLHTWRRHIASEHGPASPITRLVLHTLAVHMDRNGGNCFPSTKLLAAESGLSERVVVQHLGGAASTGWIEKSSAGIAGQGWKRNQYRAALPEVLAQDQHVDLRGTNGKSVPLTEGTEVESARCSEGTDSDRKKALTQSQCKYTIEPSNNKNLQRTFFLLKDKTEFEISADLIRVLSQAYPSVDLSKEFRAIQAWCLTNPEKRKTRRGAPAFVNRWIQRAQNNGSRQPEPPAPKRWEL